MFEIYYNGSIPFIGRYFYLVGDSGTIYEVHCGVPPSSGYIVTPEPARLAVVLHTEGFDRIASTYVLPGLHGDDFAHLWWPIFADWVNYVRVPRGLPLVHFRKEV